MKAISQSEPSRMGVAKTDGFAALMLIAGAPHVYGAVKARRNQPRRTLKQAISRWIGHGISAIATRLFSLLR